MASNFKKGAKVQQTVKPIVGEVGGYQVDQQTGDILVLVKWVDGKNQSSRYFKESELSSAA